MLLATNVQPVLDIINNWIFVARALVGSVGALAFVLALACEAKTPSVTRAPFDLPPAASMEPVRQSADLC